MQHYSDPLTLNYWLENWCSFEEKRRGEREGEGFSSEAVYPGRIIVYCFEDSILRGKNFKPFFFSPLRSLHIFPLTSAHVLFITMWCQIIETEVVTKGLFITPIRCFTFWCEMSCLCGDIQYSVECGSIESCRMRHETGLKNQPTSRLNENIITHSSRFHTFSTMKQHVFQAPQKTRTLKMSATKGR